MYSRNEKILTSIINGTEYWEIPQSRIEALLIELKDTIENSNGGSADLSDYYTKLQTNDLISGKVDKVSGMGLSQNSFTDNEKSKLESLENYDNTEIKSGISELKNKKHLDEQSIPSGADLNEYISDYFQIYTTGSQAITQTILNRPADVNDNRFTLETWKNGSYNYIQRITHCAYTTARPPAIYIRSCSGGSSSAPDLVWSDWYKFTPVKVENNTNTVNTED